LADGVFSFTVQATNRAGSIAKTFSIVISTPVTQNPQTDVTNNPNTTPDTKADKKPTVFKVKFNANGGKIASKKSKTISREKGKALGKLPKATRAKYKFKGWYTKKNGGKKVTSKTKVAKAITLYAHWQKKQRYGKVVRTTALYVRAYPSPHKNTMPVIGYIKRGQMFKVTGFVDRPGKKGDWYKLKYKDRTAYVYAKYVNIYYK
jgi:uncharacterized repeat protein (TIGR02543 family)